MKAARGTYCLMPTSAIADRNLTKTALRVLAFMSLNANAKREVYWSARRIGKTTRVDEREVRHAISLLKTRGHIVRVRGPGGDRKSVTYRIVFADPKWPADHDDEEGEPTASGRGEPPTPRRGEFPPPEVGGVSRMVGGVSHPGRGLFPPLVGGNPPYKLESELDSELETGRERGASRATTRKKAKHPIDEDWTPTDRDLEYARSKGLSDERIADQAERFRDNHLTKASTFADWSAAWRTWIRNAVDPNHFSNQGRTHQSRSSVADAGIDRAIARRERQSKIGYALAGLDAALGSAEEDKRLGITRNEFGRVISRRDDAAKEVEAEVVKMKNGEET